jgi:hypothetical protein
MATRDSHAASSAPKSPGETTAARCESPLSDTTDPEDGVYHAESPLPDATAGSETGVEASLFADLAEGGDIARNRKRQRQEMLAVGEQFLVTWRGLDQRLEQASDGVGETYDLPDWCTMELPRESNCLVCTTEAGTSFSLQLCAATHMRMSEDKPGSLLLTTHGRPLFDRGRSLIHLVLYMSYSMGTVPNTLLVSPWSNPSHANWDGATRRARTSIYPSNIAIARRIMLSILCRTIGITPCRAGASSDIRFPARSNDPLVGGCRGRRTTVATQQTLCMADRMMSSMLEERARPVH